MFENLKAEDLPPIEATGHPEWFHVHGLKMDFKPEESDAYRATIRSRSTWVARLVVARAESPKRLYEARWEIKQPSSRPLVHGEVLMGEEDLARAFALIEPTGANKPGSFIRSGCALNIAYPGTRRDGDQNISICLDRPIREGILALLTA